LLRGEGFEPSSGLLGCRGHCLEEGTPATRLPAVLSSSSMPKAA
jgi:hypothetical protein